MRTIRKLAEGVAFGAMLVLAGMPAVSAHSGGLDKSGCHHDRKNGGYHCHRGTDVAVPRASLAPASMGPAGQASSGGQRAFRNCDEARAAGAAPVSRGEPGYGPHLDRDGDGVGCEPYRGR